MASILNVDQINNAAGTSAVTIDASTGHATFPNGMTLPAGVGGKVLQVAENSGSNTFSSSASSWVTTPVTGTITPLSSTSLIIGVATVAVWRSSVGYFGVRAVNSGGNTSQVMARGDGYISGASISWDTTYPFSYTAGSTSAITTTFQLHPNGGASYFPNDASTFTGETNFQRWHVRLMEIAQ